MNGQMTQGLVIVLAIGTAIGVSVGMLYAPHSGVVTRKLIGEKFLEVRHEAQHVAVDARRRSKQILTHAISRNGK